MSNGAAQQADVEVPAMLEQGGGCPVNEKKRMPDGWEPPYPSYAARLNDTVTEPVFAYIGGQSLSEDDLKPFTEWMEGVLASGRSKPEVVNRATFTDEAGVRTRYICCTGVRL